MKENENWFLITRDASERHPTAAIIEASVKFSRNVIIRYQQMPLGVNLKSRPQVTEHQSVNVISS